MILSKSDVERLILEGASRDIKLSRKLSKEMNMHVTGKGAADYLEGLDEYENNNQKILREKIMKSNKSIFSFILRPLDRIFSAKGGAINFNLTENEVAIVKNAVSDIADGLNIRRFLKKVVLKKYVIDPNGVLFVDLDDKGELNTSFVGTTDIMWYKNKGNKIDAIIFESEEQISAQGLQDYDYSGHNHHKDSGVLSNRMSPLPTNKELLIKRKYYRVIDETTDRIFVLEPSPEDDKVSRVREVVKERLVNFFGFVPAMVVGDLKSPNENIFESFISDVNEEAKDLLHDVSINKIHKISQGFAKYWQRPEACTKCKGEGVIKYEEVEGDDIWLEDDCSSCGGTGYKQKVSPSDVMIVPVPEKDENDPAPNVAGYVNPSIEIWKKYDDNIRDTRSYLYQVLWGTAFEQGGRNETATGRFIDQQPVTDRLRDVSHTFSILHQFILDCYGIITLNNPKYKSYVSYGTRYIIENADEILKTLMEASREKVSDVIIQDMRAKYFFAEYQNDEVELAKKQKIARIEPFPNMSVSEVQLSNYIGDEEKLEKIYFVAWYSSLTSADIVLKPDERLKKELNNFIKTKVNGIKKEDIPSNGVA